MIEKVSANRYVVNDYQGVRIVDARRQKKGFPWVISRLGVGNVATIEVLESQDLQLKMVMALLEKLSEDVIDCRCLTCRRKRKAGANGLVNA